MNTELISACCKAEMELPFDEERPCLLYICSNCGRPCAGEYKEEDNREN